MHEVQPRVLERVVEWLYSGEVGEISGVAEGMAPLEGSRFLRVERMEARCSAWVCAHVEASNCVAAWAEASRLGCGVVAERALLVVGGGSRRWRGRRSSSGCRGRRCSSWCGRRGWRCGASGRCTRL
jgi:hypothetical protein